MSTEARHTIAYTLVCTSCCAGWPTDVDHGTCKHCGGDLELRGVVHVFDLKEGRS